MYYDYHMMNGNDAGWGIAMTLFWLVFLIVAATVAVHVLRGHDHHHHQTVEKVDPVDIAKERYAKGDITKDQFEQLKKDLSK